MLDVCIITHGKTKRAQVFWESPRAKAWVETNVDYLLKITGDKSWYEQHIEVEPDRTYDLLDKLRADGLKVYI
jgi:hypothetical protein